MRRSARRRVVLVLAVRRAALLVAAPVVAALLVAAPVVAALLVAAPVLSASTAAHAVPASVRWAWPLAGPHEVSRAFTPPAHRYGAGHRGVDLPAGPGAVVRAAGAGRVSYAGLLAGRGVVVVVHGDLRTTYEPVDPVVALGDEVGAGAPLGRLAPGHPGCGAAACLHWGLRRGDDYLDPVALVERPPLRLLPVGPPQPPPRALRPEPVGALGASGRAAGQAEPAPSAGPAEDGRAPALPTAAAAAALAGSALVAAATGAALRRGQAPVRQPPRPRRR